MNFFIYYNVKIHYQKKICCYISSRLKKQSNFIADRARGVPEKKHYFSSSPVKQNNNAERQRK